jgi:hypothetical protein
MDWSLLPRDVWLAVIATLGSLPLALATVARRREESPVWPVRLYLFIFTMVNIPGVRSYASSRKTFSLREQFVASWFVWFFILFSVLLFNWACPRRGC